MRRSGGSRSVPPPPPRQDWAGPERGRGYSDFPELNQPWSEPYGTTRERQERTSPGYRVGLILLWVLVVLVAAAAVAIGVFGVGVPKPGESEAPATATPSSPAPQLAPPGSEASPVGGGSTPPAAPRSPLLNRPEPQPPPAAAPGRKTFRLGMPPGQRR